VAAQIYVFLCERHALAWGILGPMFDDYSFHWVAFLDAPLQQLPSLVTCTFLHANVAHITSNLLFFLLFAPSVERTMGPLFFLAGYFVWGAAAALTQGFFSPYSNGLIGASGAISGAAGACFVLHPLRLPVSFLERWLGKWISRIPAFFFIGIWFLGQLQEGFRSLTPEALAGRITEIAYWAHVGGFGAGAVTVLPWILGRSQGEPAVTA